MVAEIMVLVAGAATTWLVAEIVGLPLFHDRLRLPQGRRRRMSDFAPNRLTAPPPSSRWVALAVAALTALAVTWYLSRRLQRSVADRERSGRWSLRHSLIAATWCRTSTHSPRPLTGWPPESNRSRLARRRLFGDLADEIHTPVSVVTPHLEAHEDGAKTRVILSAAGGVANSQIATRAGVGPSSAPARRSHGFPRRAWPRSAKYGPAAAASPRSRRTRSIKLFI
ncbi:hypothetical protein VIMS_00513 [Mycobacterium marinum]|nr:hypothetical protein VIMS_00513 [Mycobacterium marinum]